MRSRKLQALDFVKRYWARWGHSPTYSEIAAEIGVSSQRARELVVQLSDERQLEILRGKTRGIRLIDRREEISEADVMIRLAQLGWHIGDLADVDAGAAQAPLVKKPTDGAAPGGA
jgi:SOS-response transcriptional repressor LexA